MLKRRTTIAWGILLAVLLGTVFVPSLIRTVGLATSVSTPLSKAIVAALDQSPRGLTDVADGICPLATQEAAAKAVAELWPIGAHSNVIDSIIAKGRGIPDGTVAASFSKPNGFLEGVQTLWLMVNEKEKFCRAHIQTYSW
jgi:hypothetical protein